MSFFLVFLFLTSLFPTTPNNFKHMSCFWIRSEKYCILIMECSPRQIIVVSLFVVMQILSIICLEISSVAVDKQPEFNCDKKINLNTRIISMNYLIYYNLLPFSMTVIIYYKLFTIAYSNRILYLVIEIFHYKCYLCSRFKCFIRKGDDKVFRNIS